MTRCDDAYHERTRHLLEGAYLAGDDPRRQSGFSGDEAKWEWLRRPVLAAVDADGTFLDVGCANGYLMESVHRWAAEDGHAIETYGLDLIPSLADLARHRLPRWADRIFTGDVLTWEPPRRFDVVRTELVYAPPRRRRHLVERLLARSVAPRGRLIVCSYGSTASDREVAAPVGALLRQWGLLVAGTREEVAANGRVGLRMAWVERNAT